MNTNSTPAVFQFNAAEVRCHIDEQGEPWFLANDVCEILGYANPRQAVQKNCKEGGVSKRDTPTESGIQSMTFINEGNLYRLIIKSRKPEAEAFEQHVMDVILPTIRKTGRYETPTEPGITPAQQRQLQEAITARFPDGKHRPYAWSRFNNHFQLGSYKQLPTSKTAEALAYIANMPLPGQIEAETPVERMVMDKLRFSRFCLYFDSDGKMNLKEIPDGGRMMQDADIARIIGDPAMVDKRLLPEIISAAADRLRKYP